MSISALGPSLAIIVYGIGALSGLAMDRTFVDSKANWRRSCLAGLGRIGVGIAKLLVFSPALNELAQAEMRAIPAARSSPCAWFGCLALASEWYLILSGIADVLVGIRGCFTARRKEIFGVPFWATTWAEFWSAWFRPFAVAGKSGGAGVFMGAIGSMLTVLIPAVLWWGAGAGTVVWAGLQITLLALECWRGKSLFAPLPLPVRAFLIVAIQFLAAPLLFVHALDHVMDIYGRLSGNESPTVYSLLLDQVLSRPWLMACLWTAVLTCVAFPPSQWLFAQRAGPIFAVLGVLMGVAGVALLTRYDYQGVPHPQKTTRYFIRHWVQSGLLKLFGEGTGTVFVGRDGWLYDRKELDAFFFSRPAGRHGATSNLVRLREMLKGGDTRILAVIVPGKANLLPDPILPAEYEHPVEYPGYRAKMEKLKAAGIAVLDPSQQLWDMRKKTPLFFRTDSRWTPEHRKEVALETAKTIRAIAPEVVSDRTPLVDVKVSRVEGVGNLAVALDPWSPGSVAEPESALLVSISGLEKLKAPILTTAFPEFYGFDSPGPDVSALFGVFVHQLGALLGREVDFTGLPLYADAYDRETSMFRTFREYRLVIALIPASEL